MKPRMLLYASLVTAFSLSALAAESSQQTRIPFANLGGIRDWRADGDSALHIEGRNGKWYHAELLGFCPNLQYAERIGFVIEPTGDFDHFSSILVRGRQCPIKALSESGPPPPKAERNKGAQPHDEPTP